LQTALQALIAHEWNGAQHAMKSLLRIASVLCGASGALARLVNTRRKRIVVVRYDDLGDLVLWLPAAKRIREAFPKGEWRITLLGKPANRSLNEICPYWDETLDMKTGVSLANALNALKILLALLLADIYLNPMPNLSKAWLAAFTGAPKRICFDMAPEELVFRSQEASMRDRALHSSQIPPEGANIVEMNWRFAASLCGDRPLEIDANMASWIPQNPSFKDKEYLLIAPGAGNPRRRWSERSFAKAADSALRNLGFKKAILCGSETETGLIDSVIGLMEEKGKAENLAGTRLPELSWLVKSAKAVLTNESGISHLAALHGTPSVSILGGGHFGRFLPYPEKLGERCKGRSVFKKMECFNCNWRCSVDPDGKGPFPCIAAVSIEEAVEALKALAAASRARAESEANGALR